LQLYRNMARLCRMMPNAPYAELEVRNRHDRVIRRHCVDRELILCELDRRAAREEAGSEQEGIEYAMEPEALVFLGDPPIDETLLTLPPSAWSRLEASMHGRRRSTSLDGRAHLVEALGEEAIEGLMTLVLQAGFAEQARGVLQVLRPRVLFERSLEKLLDDIPDDELSGWLDVFLASVTRRRDEADLEAAFAQARPEVRWRLARGFVALIQDQWMGKEDEARLRRIMADVHDAHVDEVVMSAIGDFIPERD
jgi:hypothetical protein